MLHRFPCLNIQTYVAQISSFEHTNLCCTDFLVLSILLCSCTVVKERLVAALEAMTLTQDWRLMTTGAISDNQLKVPPPPPPPEEEWRETSSSTFEITQTKDASTLIRLISHGSCAKDEGTESLTKWGMSRKELRRES